MNNKTYFLLIYFFSYAILAYGQVSVKDTLYEEGHQVVCFDITKDGNYLASGGSDNKIIIWDAEKSVKHKVIEELETLPLSLRFSERGKYIVVGGEDSMVTIWDMKSGEKIMSLSGHEDEVNSLAISPNNKYIASGSDETVIFWDMISGEEVFKLKQHSGQVTAVTFDNEGNRFISGCVDGYINVWNPNEGELIKSVKAHDEAISSFSFSPCGNLIASSSKDNSIVIWNAHNLKVHSYNIKHREKAVTLDFSPDGKYLVSGGYDNYMVITEVNTGKIAFHSEKQSEHILSVLFKPNGKEIISSSFNSDKLLVWDSSRLNITPHKTTGLAGTPIESMPEPNIEWVTENNVETGNVETGNVGYRVKYRILSEYSEGFLQIHRNNEIQLNETSFETTPGYWNDFENIVYLDEGENDIQVEFYYSDGMVASDTLRVNYNKNIPAIISEPEKTRQITVMLRQGDEYEYTIRGTEGYSFHSEKINVTEETETVLYVELEPLKKETSITLNDIYFATDSDELTSESFAELDRVVDLIFANPRIIVEIAAHTCDLGTDAYNMRLSGRRAQSVVDYLVDNEVPEDRLVAKGYGLRQPLVPNISEENRALNRRVEFTIIDIVEGEEIEEVIIEEEVGGE